MLCQREYFVLSHPVVSYKRVLTVSKFQVEDSCDVSPVKYTCPNLKMLD